MGELAFGKNISAANMLQLVRLLFLLISLTNSLHEFDVAGRLIEYAKLLGQTLSYDDIYGAPKAQNRRKTDKPATPASNPQHQGAAP